MDIFDEDIFDDDLYKLVVAIVQRVYSDEVVMMLVKEEIVVPIIKAIYATTDYQSGARGLVFALPVSYVTGMTHIKPTEDDLA